MRNAFRLSLSCVTVALILLLSSAVRSNGIDHANELYRAGKYRHAVDAYRAALREGANPAVAWYNQGNAWYQLDSLSEAAACYETALLEAPDFCRAHLNLGVLHFNAGDPASAVASLQRAAACDSASEQILLVLAASYRSLEAWGAAVPPLETVVELSPARAEPRLMLFDIYRALGEWDTARSWLESVPDSSAQAAEKYRLLGELAQEALGPREVAYYYGRLVQIDPERRWGWFHLCQALFAQDAVLSGLDKAHEALERFGDFSELALLAGNKAFERGYYHRAEEFYRRAYRLGSPGGVVGIQNLIRAYEQQGDTRRASELVKLGVNAAHPVR
jgi:tetratricopeptide (TPR) repeat protein